MLKFLQKLTSSLGLHLLVVSPSSQPRGALNASAVIDLAPPLEHNTNTPSCDVRARSTSKGAVVTNSRYSQGTDYSTWS